MKFGYIAQLDKRPEVSLTGHNFPRNNSRPIARHELLVREFLAVLVLAVILIGLALALPAGYVPNPETPLVSVKAPWLIAWLQVLLRHFQPGIAAFLIPITLFAMAASLPWLPGAGRANFQGQYRFGLHQAVIFAIALVLAVLTFSGL